MFLSFKIIKLNPRTYDTFLDKLRGRNHVISKDDIKKIKTGKHTNIFEVEGAHETVVNGVPGVIFCVDILNADEVSVELEDGRSVPMRRMRQGVNIWEVFIPELKAGQKYRFKVLIDGQWLTKSDPVGFGVTGEELETRFSVVTKLPKVNAAAEKKWIKKRKEINSRTAPINIHEISVGSFSETKDGKPKTFKELTKEAIQNAKDMGYTHIQVMPPFGQQDFGTTGYDLESYAFYDPWGYKNSECFSIEGRYGTIHDFKDFIDECHKAGLGVILDWVPAHFCPRECGLGGLGYGDEITNWRSYVFNLERNEVKSFLLSNINFWLKLGIDGVRVDYVPRILYSNPEEKKGFRPAGRDFLREVNDLVHQNYEGVITIGEDSTGYNGVTDAASSHEGALGFDYQFAMWLKHTLLKEVFCRDNKKALFDNTKTYFQRIIETIKGNIGKFIVYFSHDEYTPEDLKYDHHGSISDCLVKDTPKDKDVNTLKLIRRSMLYALQMLYPGKKLHFMANIMKEAWHCDRPIPRKELAKDHDSQEITKFFKKLNKLYRNEKALHQLDSDPGKSFEIVSEDPENMVVTFLRKGEKEEDTMLVVVNFGCNKEDDLNFKSIPNYRIGVPHEGEWEKVFDTFDWFSMYENIERNNTKSLTSINEGMHNQDCLIEIPKLFSSSIQVYKWAGKNGP
ncbi:alpha-amylase family glycosyl hydrolase [Candidatus Margulisiibacteriota bacterium]